MQIRRGESLKALNTLAIDARTNGLAVVKDDAELLQSLAWAKAEGVQALALGEGSNIVFASDIDALFIRQSAAGLAVLQQGERGVHLRVSAGENWHALVEKTLQQGWYGLENLALIPGNVGAAPIQNIGAYGVEFERFVVAVNAIEIDSAKPLSLTAAECRFGYRDSVFKHALRDKLIITSVEVQLGTRPSVECAYPALAGELDARGVSAPTPQDVFNAVVAVRRRRLPDPAREPNAGSFFKNPVIAQQQLDDLRARFSAMPYFSQPDARAKIPAAWLIEQAGWKGHREGAFGVHPDHALVMINYGGGTGGALLQLAGKVVQSVEEKFGISLEMEPRVYGKP